jgi:hypothetical protein
MTTNMTPPPPPPIPPIIIIPHLIIQSQLTSTSSTTLIKTLNKQLSIEYSLRRTLLTKLVGITLAKQILNFLWSKTIVYSIIVLFLIFLTILILGMMEIFISSEIAAGITSIVIILSISSWTIIDLDIALLCISQPSFLFRLILTLIATITLIIVGGARPAIIACSIVVVVTMITIGLLDSFHDELRRVIGPAMLFFSGIGHFAVLIAINTGLFPFELNPASPSAHIVLGSTHNSHFIIETTQSGLLTDSLFSLFIYCWVECLARLKTPHLLTSIQIRLKGINGAKAPRPLFLTRPPSIRPSPEEKIAIDILRKFSLPSELEELVDENMNVVYHIENSLMYYLLGSDNTEWLEEKLWNQTTVKILLPVTLVSVIILLLGTLEVIPSEIGAAGGAIVFCIQAFTASLNDLKIARVIIKEPVVITRTVLAGIGLSMFVIITSAKPAIIMVVILGIFAILVSSCNDSTHYEARHVTSVPAIVQSTSFCILLWLLVGTGQFKNQLDPNSPQAKFVWGTFGFSRYPLESTVYGLFNEAMASLIVFLLVEVWLRMRYRKTHHLNSIFIWFKGVDGDDAPNKIFVSGGNLKCCCCFGEGNEGAVVENDGSDGEGVVVVAASVG